MEEEQTQQQSVVCEMLKRSGRKAGCRYLAVPLTEEDGSIKGAPTPDTAARQWCEQEPPHCVELVWGSVPILITVPHGGYLSPATVPTRNQGCLVHDDCSQELARAVYAEMVQRLNQDEQHATLFPHFVVLHLSRTKVDVNRPLEGAVDDHRQESKAVLAHKAYHSFIEEALRWSVDHWGFAHLFDMHGQSHRQVMEFGFLLTTDHLNGSDKKLDDEGNDLLSHSSLSGMARWHNSKLRDGRFSLSDVVRGHRSLGALLQSHALECVPSPKYPSPSQTPPFCPNMPYFWGAWTTRHYAQRYQQHAHKNQKVPAEEEWMAFVSTTQVEPTHVARCDPATRATYARALAQAFAEFVRINYSGVTW